MKTYNGTQTFHALTKEIWRAWLAQHHQTEKSVWLVIYKKESGIPSVYYPEAVKEALCFGWIDSTPNKRDAKSYYQFFSKRNPKSNWSKTNKEKVAQLIEQGLMQEAGYRMIEIAQQNGTWTALDEVENLVIPADLQALFNQHPQAYKNYEAFPRSSKRGILEWIVNAKRPETRTQRITQTVEKAAQNIKANHYRQ